MPTRASPDSPAGEGPSPGPDDGFLIAGLLGGDAAALNKLMDRYDRLVRFAVFRASKDRCSRDPEWLESIASATWAGFVRSMQRDPGTVPKSVPAYVVRIARNQVASALRDTPPDRNPLRLDTEGEPVRIEAQTDEPVEILSRLELLEVLRGCLAQLGPDDRTLTSQLEAITKRRWKQAADALGMRESTLRSRWERVLKRLRGCVERKTGESIAPSGPEGDS